MARTKSIVGREVDPADAVKAVEIEKAVKRAREEEEELSEDDEVQFVEVRVSKQAKGKGQATVEAGSSNIKGADAPASPKKVATSEARKAKAPAVAISVEDLTGTYTIIAKVISDGWGNSRVGYHGIIREAFQVSLVPSSTKSRLWGSLDFEPAFRGFLRSSSLADLLTGKTNKLAFRTRGQDTDSTRSAFDDGDVGEMVFLGDGRIAGKMSWDASGPFEFQGFKKEGKEGQQVEHLGTQKEGWRMLSEKHFHMLEISRWGSWSHYTPPEKPAASDSDVAEGDSDDNEEEEDEGW